MNDQELAQGLAYCVAVLEKTNREVEEALTRAETSQRLEREQEWVALARHHSLHPDRAGKFLLCEIKDGIAGPWMSICAPDKAATAWRWINHGTFKADFVARDGVILMQRKDVPVKPPASAPALSPRMQLAIARAQRLIGGAA